MLLHQLKATACYGAAHAGNIRPEQAALTVANACLLQVTPAGQTVMRNMVSVLVRGQLGE